MNIKGFNRRHRGLRRAMVSIEVAMTAGVMLPVAGILLFLGIKMCAALYQANGSCVAWPFL